MSMLTRCGNYTLMAVSALTIMVGCVIVPGLPAIATALHVSSAQSWIVTLPSLGVVIFGPFVGSMIRFLGLRRSLQAALFFYGLLGAGAVILQGYTSVILDRLMLGAATSIVMTAGTGLLSSFYDADMRMRMIARQGMAIELGGVIFLAAGGALAGLGWRWPFVLYLFSWLLLVAVEVFVPEPGAIDAGKDNGKPQGALNARLFRVYFFALMSMVIFFTAIICLPDRLHAIAFSSRQTGYFLSFTSLVAVGAACLMPSIVRRVGEYCAVSLGFLFYGCAHLLFAYQASSFWSVLGAVFLGFGFGITVPLANNMVVESASAPARSQALAHLAAAIFMGQFLSAMVQTLVEQTGGVFHVAAGLALAIAVISAVWHARFRSC